MVAYDEQCTTLHNKTMSNIVYCIIKVIFVLVTQNFDKKQENGFIACNRTEVNINVSYSASNT